MRGRFARLRGQGGYTLSEMIVVLATFLTVAAALTSMFASGAKAELDANKRFQAQQNARLALDKMRRELHCASGVTNVDGSALGTTPVAAIRVTLPSHCPSAAGTTITVDYQTVAVATGRWQLDRAAPSGTAKVADYITSDAVFTYTAQSASTRALLHVDFPINVNPNEGWNDWRLADDIVLRNTVREDP